MRTTLAPRSFISRKSSCDLRPLGVPVVLQQPALLIVIVVEAPRDERAAIVQNEAASILRDPDEFHWRGSGPLTSTRRARRESPMI